jgi:hypothetical protein
MAKKVNIEIDVDSKSLGQLEQELEKVNEELKDLDRNSDAFKEAAAKSQILNKEIEKINNEIDGFKLEDKLMAADGAAKIFGGSLSAAVGTLGALGIESEAFGEFEQKAASAIAVGLGIKDVSEGFGQVTLAAKKSGIAAKLFGTTTKRALVATGVGVFAIALGAIVNNWDAINKGVSRFVKNTPFIGKAIDTIKGAFDSLFDAARPVLEFLGILPNEAERAAIAIKKATKESIKELEREIAVAEASGKAAQDIYDLKKRLLEAEIQDLKDSNAEKEEIFAKETELLALNAVEQKRIRDEKANEVVREKVQTVSTIKASGVQELKLEEDKETKLGDVTQLSTERRNRLKDSEIINQLKLDAARKASLDNVIAIAGAESNIGKAALIAKQALMAKELIMEASKTLAFSSQAVARSTVAVAEGTAQTAKIGFPQNIPLLIGYAAQAVGIISAIKDATSAAKSSGVATVSTPRGASAPAFNVVGAAPENQLAEAISGQQKQPIKAFVVSNEITTQQELDRNITSEASIG